MKYNFTSYHSTLHGQDNTIMPVKLNNNIKELVNIAFNTTNYPADQLYQFEPNQAFCERFAKLIITKCADIALREDHDAHECIKAYFGVENDILEK